MWNAQLRPRAPRQRMRLYHPAIEHAELLLRQRKTLDAVGVKHRRVRGKARPDRGRSVIACPVGELRQGRPVWLLLQIRGARLRAGYHEAIETGIPQFTDIPVSRGNFLPAAI